jgi:hypothetical protein
MGPFQRVAGMASRHHGCNMATIAWFPGPGLLIGPLGHQCQPGYRLVVSEKMFDNVNSQTPSLLLYGDMDGGDNIFIHNF